MSAHNSHVQDQESKPHRTLLEDLTPEGYCLSEEELKLVAGGSLSNGSVVTRPLADSDPTWPAGHKHFPD